MWTGAVNGKVLVKESYWAPTVRRCSIPLTVQLPGLRQRSANLCWSELGSVRKQTRWCLRLMTPDVALPSPSYSTRDRGWGGGAIFGGGGGGGRAQRRRRGP